MKFKNIKELNFYLDSKEELKYSEWVNLIENNEDLIDSESLKGVEENYNKLNFKDFGFSFFEFKQTFEENLFY